MTTDHLHAYVEDKHIGQFIQVQGEVSFEYDEAATVTTPISLSLPAGQTHQTGAAEAYLDNLLDRDNVRERWVRELWFWSSFELPSAHIFKPPSPSLRTIEQF